MWDAWPAGRPLVLAHRGLAPGYRENTLTAVRAAFASGADAVEVDVRCTSDGVPVLHHDPELAGHAIRQTPLARLRDEAASAGYDLARLAHLLDPPPAGALDVEIKDPAATGPVLDLLADHGDVPALVSSFDPDVVAEVRRRAPEMPVGLILGRRRAYRLAFARSRARRWRAWIGEAEPDVLVLHRWFLRLGLAGTVFAPAIPVFVWTVNRHRSLWRAMGHPLVAGVITDRPAAAHRARSLETTDHDRRGIDETSNGSQQPG